MTSAIEQTGAAVLRFAAGIMAADQGQIAAAAAPDITWAVPGSRQGQRDVPRARQGTALARGPRGRVISNGLGRQLRMARHIRHRLVPVMHVGGWRGRCCTSVLYGLPH